MLKTRSIPYNLPLIFLMGKGADPRTMGFAIGKTDCSTELQLCLYIPFFSVCNNQTFVFSSIACYSSNLAKRLNCVL